MNFNYKTKTLSFTSGKGGVGKTTLTANVGLRLAQAGKKVLIFDADLGMANVDIFFGKRAPSTINDVLTGKKKVKEVIMPLEPNLFLISGGHGFEELQNLNAFSRRAVMDSLNEVTGIFDYLIIDTSPGIAPNVLQTNAAVQNINIILTQDPASFADSYALIKVLNSTYKVNRFSIVCNQVKNHEDGFYLFKRFQDVVHKFLNVGLEYLGAIPLDGNLRSSNYQQRLIMKQDSGSDSAIAISQIANEILKSHNKMNTNGGLQLFWENMAG